MHKTDSTHTMLIKILHFLISWLFHKDSHICHSGECLYTQPCFLLSLGFCHLFHSDAQEPRKKGETPQGMVGTLTWEWKQRHLSHWHQCLQNKYLNSFFYVHYKLGHRSLLRLIALCHTQLLKLLNFFPLTLPLARSQLSAPRSAVFRIQLLFQTGFLVRVEHFSLFLK